MTKVKEEIGYIGVIEHNDWEGETFGYYVPDTPENRLQFEILEEKLESLGNMLDQGFGGYSFDYEPSTEKELHFLNKGANNGYMDRVNYVTQPFDWQPIIDAFTSENDVLYKGGDLPLNNKP